jgi:hypothetical protein
VRSDDGVVIEVFGEGKTDVEDEPTDPTPEQPGRGVLSILVHTLCGRPAKMQVKRYGRRFMMRPGSLKQKARFAKRQARYNRSAAAVFVVDSDGDLKGRTRDLVDGRRMETGDFPMAVGVAHPCVEAWLLADAAAIRRGVNLSADPACPERPEALLATSRDAQRNPKAELARVAGGKRGDLSAREKQRIAAAMNDVPLVRRRGPQSFAPFADEVECHIRPLF